MNAAAIPYGNMFYANSAMMPSLYPTLGLPGFSPSVSYVVVVYCLANRKTKIVLCIQNNCVFKMQLFQYKQQVLLLRLSKELSVIICFACVFFFCKMGPKPAAAGGSYPTGTVSTYQPMAAAGAFNMSGGYEELNTAVNHDYGKSYMNPQPGKLPVGVNCRNSV